MEDKQDYRLKGRGLNVFVWSKTETVLEVESDGVRAVGHIERNARGPEKSREVRPQHDCANVAQHSHRHCAFRKALPELQEDLNAIGWIDLVGALETRVGGR